ncbi:MAG: peptidoglycan-binding domain-containing protein [Armatimonadota bacterium]|nr:peptidoglycan-binding domain-containing protein [Armatimonadota bacterium]MDR7520481.1 peptidoglycan-binding domain-containing protein [Armatimonadota bacterium]MDR7548939.1 peptidoglycan-binding domain-containing protein [Armatimonadota bacterium]
MNLDAAVGAAWGSQGAAVEELQRALLRLGYYGIRFAMDGDYGRNTLGAVLACKYDLVTFYGVEASDLGYAPVAGNPASLIASGTVNAAFVSCLQTLLAGQRLGGQEPWILPTRAQVADADLDVRAFLAAEAQRAPFPPQLFWQIIGVESGVSHFDPLGNVKFGIDWLGGSYAQTVNFAPAASREPWVRSRGWGLTQYTPSRAAALPRPMPDYILSVGANLRTAIRVFINKFERFTARHPCSYPSAAAPSYDCRTCLRGRRFDPSTYSDQRQEPCSWLKGVWAYNGLTAAGRTYMERVIRQLMR